MDRELKIVCAAILAVIVSLVAFMLLVASYDPEICRRRFPDHETRFLDLASGCQVKINGKWWPEDSIRVTED